MEVSFILQSVTMNKKSIAAVLVLLLVLMEFAQVESRRCGRWRYRRCVRRCRRFLRKGKRSVEESSSASGEINSGEDLAEILTPQ